MPRRKSILQLAALTAAVLIGFELVLTHWFYLYIPWFFPFVAFALLYTPCPRPRRFTELAAAVAAARLPRLVGACSTAAGTTTNEIVDIPVYAAYGDRDRGRRRAVPRLPARVPAGRAAGVRRAGAR